MNTQLFNDAIELTDGFKNAFYLLKMTGMNNFDIAIEKLLKNEGGYVNDPDDLGGETYKGITRKYNPDWIGWKTIDACDNKDEITASPALDNQVKLFYRENYWNKLNGDRIRDIEIAISIFDFAVNAGLRTSIIITKRCLGINGDRIIGETTLTALNTVIPELFLLRFTVEKIKHYTEICKKNKKQKKFFFGWVLRALR